MADGSVEVVHCLRPLAAAGKAYARAVSGVVVDGIEARIVLTDLLNERLKLGERVAGGHCSDRAPFALCVASLLVRRQLVPLIWHGAEILHQDRAVREQYWIPRPVDEWQRAGIVGPRSRFRCRALVAI